MLDQLDTKKRGLFWQKIITEGVSIVMVAESDKGVICFISDGQNPESATAELELYDAQLYAIYVLQDYQGKGIGKQLV